MNKDLELLEAGKKLLRCEAGELLRAADNISYELILGFRKIKGINKKDFIDKYKIDIKSIRKVTELLREKKLIDDGENIFINPKYLYISNEILINFLENIYENKFIWYYEHKEVVWSKMYLRQK